MIHKILKNDLSVVTEADVSKPSARIDDFWHRRYSREEKISKKLKGQKKKTQKIREDEAIPCWQHLSSSVK